SLVSCIFFFSSRRRHTRLVSDWSSDVCSSDLEPITRSASAVASRSRTVAGADALLVIGSRLNQATSGDYRIPAMGQRWMHVDLRSEERRVGKGGRSRGAGWHWRTTRWESSAGR